MSWPKAATVCVASVCGCISWCALVYAIARPDLRPESEAS